MNQFIKISLIQLACWVISAIILAFSTRSPIALMWYCGLFSGFTVGRYYQQLKKENSSS